MSRPESLRVDYVLKRYPRLSETFIVAEILAHEAASLQIEIFALRPPSEAILHESNERVQAPVHYLPYVTPRICDWWRTVRRATATSRRVSDLLEVSEEEVALDDLHQALILANEIRLRRIHHLHAHFASAATTVARLAAHFAGIPYSFTAHAKDIYHASVQPEDLRRKLRDATRVVTVSDYNRAYLDEVFGPDAFRVHRIYNGLDLQLFPYAPPADRPPHIVAVGRLVEKKGFGDLLDACALLAQRGCQFTCRIIGAGPEEAELRARIEQLDLGSLVALLGPLPQSEVIRHVRESAVMAAPCVVGSDGDRDGLPTVLLEAMALGTPCVSTDVTGIPEAIRDGDTGLLVPQHDVVALADALQRLLASGSMRAHLATAARALIEAEFDIQPNAARIRAVFRECVRAAAADSRAVA